MVNTEIKLALGIGLGVLAAGLVIWQRGVAQTAQDIGQGAVSAVDGALGGVLMGAANALGVPVTSKTQCQLDMEAGRTWDASFSCPAGTWLKYLVK